MKKITANDIHLPSKRLEVFLFNVGQGDHIMLKFPTLEYGIIDFYYETSNNMVEPPCLSYFKELKRTLPQTEFKKITISFFCISHTDKDHVKGISETLKWFYENGIFIRDFWLGAARDESQLNDFLRIRINILIDKFKLEERFRYNANIDLYNNGIEIFFKYFEKWRRREFKSDRYKAEYLGDGEYLVEIRPLSPPCSQSNSEAINMGPLGTQLDKYIKNLTLDVIKKILKIREGEDLADKNHISHILKIKFGETNLLFGGDTHKDIWEECLIKYEKTLKSIYFGNFDSHFIKVSHHGSKNSSSSTIWEKIIPDSGLVYLGISAGRHKGYKHPHSETMTEVREYRNDSNILSTNICNTCLEGSPFEKEHHKWYDDFIVRNINYGKVEPNNFDIEINEEIRRTTINESHEELLKQPMGLFAYIIEVPDNLKEEIKVRLALSNVVKSHECFFRNHEEKLFACCDQAL